MLGYQVLGSSCAAVLAFWFERGQLNEVFLRSSIRKSLPSSVLVNANSILTFYHAYVSWYCY